ncbi:MAG: CARDB domain-containing protein [Patescibacteria group bacterium]
MNKIHSALAALVIAVALVSVAHAYTTTVYNAQWCTGGTLAGTALIQPTNSCVSFCAGLSATCCTTKQVLELNTGEVTYDCSAYLNTTTHAAKSNQTINCGGEPCIRNSWTATVINYSGTPVTADIVANPGTITTGQSSLLTWSSTGATSCTGTNFSTGGAVSGSISVAPASDTLYTVTCQNASTSANDTVWVYRQNFNVSCTVNTGTGGGYGMVGTPVTWTAAPLYGPGAYTYSWSGTDSLSGSTNAVQKTYTTSGQKEATVTVTSGGLSISTECIYNNCTASTCQSSGINVISGEGVDIAGGIPSINSGSLVSGGTLTFSGQIQSIGTGSIDEYFQNRFQVDIGNDGTYNTNLDILGSTVSYPKYNATQMCSGGTLVYEGSDVQDTGNLSDPVGLAQLNCSNGGGAGPGLQSGQCCQTNFRHESCAPPTICYYYFDWKVYNNATLVPETTSVTCPANYNCRAGTMVTATGVHYTIPLGSNVSVTSPSWTNIPPGTHSVRLCVDQPSLSLTETNETNNCGTAYVFTVGGPDFTASQPNLNSGSLIAGQQLTFYGTVTNAGTLSHTGTIPNRFQIDLSNNGSWDTNLDASITDLAVGQTKQPISPTWTATSGTHAVRLCADTPASITESNESNNCGSSFVITVSAPTQCQDGVDNNGNGLIDTADPACSSGGDTSEELHAVATLVMTPSKTTVKTGTTTTLVWSVTEVVTNSCKITSNVGDLWNLTGTSGSQVTSPITQETVYTLTCTSMKTGGPVSTTTRVRLAPFFEEI